MWLGVFFSAGLVLYFIDMELNNSIPFGSGINLTSMAVMMTFLALSLVIYTIRDYKIRQTRSWPHAMGRVEQVTVSKNRFGRKQIKIKYTYMVSDREYINDMFDFAQEFATEGQIKMHPELRNYGNLELLEGKLVKVYYNKESPWRSAISRRLEQSVLVTTLPSTFVILFCLYYMARLYLAIAV